MTKLLLEIVVLVATVRQSSAKDRKSFETTLEAVEPILQVVGESTKNLDQHKACTIVDWQEGVENWRKR